MANAKVVEELAGLLKQVDATRAVLAGLQEEVAKAAGLLGHQNSRHLLEVNERLVMTALENQAHADLAALEMLALARLAELDVLTQLPNRALLRHRFVHAIANAKRHNTRLALLFIDLDKFKSINDTLGHAAGDTVLRETARSLTTSIRDVDTVSRYGGDEFVILLTDIAHMSDAELVCEKLATAIAKPIEVGTRTLYMTASIGICIYPDDGLDPDALIICADAAMYREKKRKSLPDG